jgi:hypothetical protein
MDTSFLLSESPNLEDRKKAFHIRVRSVIMDYINDYFKDFLSQDASRKTID